MSSDMNTDAATLLREIRAAREARYREEAVERERHAEITIGYTYLDDGIHLYCTCGWEINLDFNPSPEDAFFFTAEHRRTVMSEFAAKRDAERAALRELVVEPATEPETGSAL